MRLTLIAASIALPLISLATAATAEKVRCSAIRDSAMCAAEPTCWYDAANNKGCLDGPAPAVDRCTQHLGPDTCNTSSFGCAWNKNDGSCVSKSG